MKFAITFGQKYNDPEISHAVLGDEVTGRSYMVVYANDELGARKALIEALPAGSGYFGDYAFIYPWDAENPIEGSFQRQIDEWDLKPLSRHLFVGPLATNDWSWQEGPE